MTATTETQQARAPRRLNKPLLAAVTLIVAVVALLAVLNISSQTPYDPDNSGPDGWQAVYEVLEDQGITVDVARGLNEFPSDVTGATVMVVGSGNLSADSGADLLTRTAAADQLLVLNPADNVGSVLDLPLRVEPGPTAPRAPDCTTQLFRDGDMISQASTTIVLTTRVPEATTCLPPSAGFEAGGAQGGAFVAFPATADAPPVVVGGFADAFTNAEVTNDANAALALRLLGSNERLVWYQPTQADQALGNPQTLLEVLPSWFMPVVYLLAASGLATMLIRGRRLGPIVTEPLPVTIKAMEVVDARARLYQRGNANQHAYRALQIAAQQHWAQRLGLSTGSSPQALVAEVAQHTGASEQHVARLLVDQPVSDDQSFVAAARELQALEEGTTPR